MKLSILRLLGLGLLFSVAAQADVSVEATPKDIAAMNECLNSMDKLIPIKRKIQALQKTIQELQRGKKGSQGSWVVPSGNRNEEPTSYNLSKLQEAIQSCNQKIAIIPAASDLYLDPDSRLNTELYIGIDRMNKKLTGSLDDSRSGDSH